MNMCVLTHVQRCVIYTNRGQKTLITSENKEKRLELKIMVEGDLSFISNVLIF